MSVHINDFIEKLKLDVCDYSLAPQIDTGEDHSNTVINTLVNLKKIIPNIICFDCGEIDSFDKLQIFPELVLLPYDSTYFEFKYKEDIISFICRRVETFIMVYLFSRNNNGWYLEAKYFFFLKDMIFSDMNVYKLDYIIEFATKDRPDGFVGMAHNTLLRTLCFLNCRNVKVVEHKPSTKLNKSRIKKNKLPIYSFHTLEIDKKKEIVLGINNDKYTHASPRIHLRRSHIREYAPGRFCAVRECVVGNIKNGIIHKDYKIKN